MRYNSSKIVFIDLIIYYALIGCLASVAIWKNGDWIWWFCCLWWSYFAGETFDSDEETGDTDDCFDYLEAEMAEGELER